MTGSVSIVGMAFRLPGAATDAELWSLLSDRRTALSPVPADRWDSDLFHDRSHATPNKTVMRRGGFLDGVDRFDARFFGISAREARAMDPQQRMLLEETWRCLENAGVRPEDLAGRKVGVFAGIMATDYQQNATAAGQAVGGFSALGTYGALLANRLSNAFEWTGPSYTVDAACASSLVALHEAHRALTAGECDFAVVAAANALINPWRSISFSQAHMLSPDGECRAFDATANGYVQGEGAVVMLLVRRQELAARKLRERAVLLGTAVNHVGPSRGITAPSVASQRAVIEAAIASAGIDRATIGYVEAHGTGTPLGDPIEAAALSAVFEASGGGDVGGSPLGIGSIKSNIGHLEAAAGLAGLAKLVLMLERGTVLPTALLKDINPLIDLERGRVRPVTEASPWPRERRRAGLSSFGFGGANGHAILERPAPDKTTIRMPSRPGAGGKRAMPYLLSAASPSSLDRLRSAHIGLARDPGDRLLGDVAQTLAQRRAALPHRAGAVVADWADVEAALSAPKTPGADGRLMLRVGRIDGLEGELWDRLARDLPELSDRREEAEEAARRDGARRSPRLTQIARLHALTAFMLDIGLAPDVLYGEGLGRWATLTASGVMDLADAVAATSEGRRPDIIPRRPRVPVYDPVLERVIEPRRLDAGYLDSLVGNLGAAVSALPDLIAQAVGLRKTNQTFRGFLDAWSGPLAARGLPDASACVGAPTDKKAAGAVLLALATARQKTCARWNIPQAGVFLDGGIDELAALVGLGALAPADALALLLGEEPTEALVDRVDVGALDEKIVEAQLPMLARTWGTIAEIEDPKVWLHGAPGRPRKPDLLNIALTLDLGKLGALPEGASVSLPNDGEFAAGLLGVLVDRWVGGTEIDWSAFEHPHRIADLPPYPFDRERYWLDLPRGPEVVEKRPAVAAASRTGASVPTFELAWSPLDALSEAVEQVVLLGGASDAARAVKADLAGDVSELIEGPDGRDGVRRDGTEIARTLLAGPLSVEAGSARTVVVTWPLERETAESQVPIPMMIERDLVIPVLRLAAGLAAGPQDDAEGETVVRLVLIGRDLARGADAPLLEPGFAAALAAARSVEAENRLSLRVSGILVGEGGQGLARAVAVDPVTALGPIAVRRSGVLVRHLAEVPPGANEQTKSDERADPQAWLLVGGFGGIGEALIRHLAKTAGRRLAVIGRRAPEEVTEIRDRLATEGAGVAYASADVTDKRSLAAAIAALEDEVGAIGTVVHGEMVLADKSAAGMTDDAFHDAFAPKAIGFDAVSEVFAHRRSEPGERLPRRVVFGSILGLTGNAGQANYAAGTAYQMAVARIAAARGEDVHHISWGYWAEVGRVANSRHRARVARIGLDPMETQSALEALDAALAGDTTEAVIAALTPARLAELSDQGFRVGFHGENAHGKNGHVSVADDGPTAGFDEIDALAMLGVRAAFDRAGWLPDLDRARLAIAEGQAPLFDALAGFLVRRGWTEPDPKSRDRAVSLAEEIRSRLPALSGIVDLVVAATDGVVPVLTGDIPGTQVIFPGGEMDLVEGYYRGNPIADAANARVTERVVERVRALSAEAGRDGPMRIPGPIRILEVGAGTGATTAGILPALDALGAEGLFEYVFTDLSIAFLRRAKRRFGAERPWFHTAKFDFDADPSIFEELGRFDIVIAANALHVTKAIDGMLHRVSARLEIGGTLILNEIMRPLEHMTAIFGLLPAWWSAEDARAGAGPLLSPEQWRTALAPRFGDVELDGPGDHGGVRQGIVVARRRATISTDAPAADVAPVAPPKGVEVPTDAVASQVLSLIAETLEIDPDRLERDANFEDLGLDSILVFELSDKLDAAFGLELDPSSIFEHATPASLIEAIASRAGGASGGRSDQRTPAEDAPAEHAPAEHAPAETAPTETASRPADITAEHVFEKPTSGSVVVPDGSAIAIIGVAGVFPGADTVAELERLILGRKPAFGVIPEGRWSDADIALAGAESVRNVRGAFLRDGERFDAARFGLSDREAQVVDPRQRLLLEQSLAALADAGRPDLHGETEAFGVFVGGGGSDFAQKLATAGHPVQPQSLAGLMPSSAAARVAHVFGLEGPAMTVDLACASGLAALHLAVGALWRGECSAALVGAASLQATPGFVLQVERAGLLSKSGVPLPFQDESDGIVIGEGAVALVLKSLERALADGDRVRAVVRGTALAQSGGGDGLTAPSARTQARVMASALADAKVGASEIVGVEAHGVGSVAGDRTEVEALATLFPANSGTDLPGVPVDTVKPVLGHGLEVSGLSALVVAMLGLDREGGLPRLPEGARFAGTTLRPGSSTSARPGPVLVNGFSLNGACAAAVLELAPLHGVEPAVGAPVEITVSAALRADLDDRLRALKDWMDAGRVAPEEVASVLAGDPARRCRVILRADDADRLGRAIDAALTGVAVGPDHRFETGALDPAPTSGANMERPVAGPLRMIGYPFARRRYWPDGGAVSVPERALAEAGSGRDDQAETPLAIVAECLGLPPERLDPSALAIELGVDSIMAIEIRSRLQARLGRSIEIAALLGDRSIGAVLDAAGTVDAGAVLVPEPENEHVPFPLTELQLAYLVGRSPSVPLGGTGCHVYWEFLSERPLDTDRLERAWNRLVAAHGMLRAEFTEDGEQRVLERVPDVRIPHHDLSTMTGDAAAVALAEIRERMAHEVFEPTRWPLFRVETSEGTAGSRVHVSIDLIIIDVLSLFGLLRLWGALYERPDLPLVVPGVSFRDYIAAFERLRNGPERQRALAFWEREFQEGTDGASLSGPNLPRARSNAELSSERFTRRRTELKAGDWARFQARARAVGATPVAALIATLGAVLGRWTEDPDFSLNLTVYDRRPIHPDIDRVIGDFTSTILLPTGSDRAGGFSEAVARTSRAVAQRLDHTLVSGAEAVRRFGDREGPATNAEAANALAYVFTSMLGYDAVIGRQDRITALGTLDWGVTQTPQVLLDAQVFEEEGRLVATWDSVDAAFPDGLLECAFEAFAAMLETLAVEEGHPAATRLTADWLGSVTEAIEHRERDRRAAINATEGLVPDDLLHEPLLRRALDEPGRVAILAPGETWTFGDLAGRALAVASLIPDMPEDTLVGVALEKSAWQIAATLGVLIAGGAYLPLDPNLPRERFRRLAEQGEVRLVLTSGALAEALDVPDGVSVVAVDHLAPEALPDRLPARKRGPDDLAYVLFTSGSTGEPKGVMIEHHAALNTVLDCNDRFAVSRNDRVFGISALGFDLSVYDIFGPPSLGAALVLPEAGSLRDPDAMADRVLECGVTIWNSVPMVLNMVLESAPHPELLAPLRLAMLSGDWIPMSLPPLLGALAPNAELVSLGGATEASIWSICHRVGALDPAWRSVPYGRPMRNQRFHVFESPGFESNRPGADLRPCADGVVGDLYIGGIGLARGYWRNREQTDVAFVSHAETGERLYRTGDLGRWRAGGLIEFLGRRDGQVKIGGFRIELGEVEAAAASHPDVRIAVALAIGIGAVASGRDGRRRLVLHAVPEPGRSLAAEEIGAHLARLLPDYMVPQTIRLAGALPLTENGKVDRNALAAGMSDAPDEVPSAPDRDGLSQAALVARISRIVAEVVGREDVAPEVSFFELGADSLSAVAVNRRLRDELGLRTRVTDLFEHPSVARLARHLAATFEMVPERQEIVASEGGLDQEVTPGQSLENRAEGTGFAERRRSGLRRAFRNRFLTEEGRRTR